MDLSHIHFIREVLVTDYAGRDIVTMQTCSSNAACLNPLFRQAPFYEEVAVRTLYHSLGGGRLAGNRFGSTVIIPNRSGWESRRQILAEQVRVVEYDPSTYETPAEQDLRLSKASQRNRRMRD